MTLAVLHDKVVRFDQPKTWLFVGFGAAQTITFAACENLNRFRQGPARSAHRFATKVLCLLERYD